MSTRLALGAFLETAIASAATCNIGALVTVKVVINGTVTITSLGPVANSWKKIRFAGALTLTHNATSLIVPGGTRTTAVGDICEAMSDESGNWRIYNYVPATGKALIPPAFSEVTAKPTTQSGYGITDVLNLAGGTLTGPLILPIYTVGTLPAATSGKMVQVSDLGGGAGPLTADGTGWKYSWYGGEQTVATDAAFTLTPLTSAPTQKHTGTLTAGRVVTLSTTNARPGSRFLVTRTGAGAFNLDIGGLKNLATNTWALVVYDGSAWYLAQYGAL